MYGMLQTAFWLSCMLSGIRDSRKAGGLWGMMKDVGGVRKSIHQRWLAKGWGLGLGLLCWGFKGVQEKIPSKEASTLQIGSVAFPPGQCASRQLHPCHRLFDQDGHQDSSLPLPIVQTLLPVTFSYSLSSEAVIMRQLRRWKRLWQRSLTRSHKRTSMWSFRGCWYDTTSALQPEEITSQGTRVPYVYYQWNCPHELSRNLSNVPRIYFFSLINKKSHICDWSKTAVHKVRERVYPFFFFSNVTGLSTVLFVLVIVELKFTNNSYSICKIYFFKAHNE